MLEYLCKKKIRKLKITLKNSLYCLPNNSYNVNSENLVLDKSVKL